MGKLIYTAITSLDGFVEDGKGKFDWAEPKEDVHTHINEQEARNGTLLFGRKLYETMAAWESPDWIKDAPAHIREYGRIWRLAEKIVYSTTLDKTASARTVIKRAFEPDEVRKLKAAAKGDIGIGGAELAGVALTHGLVDEICLYVHPIAVGNGKPAITGGLTKRMALVGTKSFASGVALLHYRI